MFLGLIYTCLSVLPVISARIQAPAFSKSIAAVYDDDLFVVSGNVQNQEIHRIQKMTLTDENPQFTTVVEDFAEGSCSFDPEEPVLMCINRSAGKIVKTALNPGKKIESKPVEIRLSKKFTEKIGEFIFF